jgi:hypothetical protein
MAEQVIRWATPVEAEGPEELRKRLAELREVLKVIRADPKNNALLPFAALPMLHFASITLFDQDEHERPILLFESNIDAPFRQYVTQLVRVGRNGVDGLFSYCKGYPGATVPNAAIVDHLAGLERRTQLYHIGHPNRSVQEIRGDYELRRSIAHEFETNEALKRLSPVDIVHDIRCKARCPSRLWPLWRPWHDDWAEAPSRPPKPPTPLNEIRWLRDHWPWGRFGRFVLLGSIGWSVGVALIVVLGHYLSVPRPVTIGAEMLGVFIFLRQTAPTNRILRRAFVAAVFGLLVAAPFQWWLFDTPPTWLPLIAVAILVPATFLLIAYLNTLRTLVLTKPLPVLNQEEREKVRKLVEAEDREEHSIYNHVAGLSVLCKEVRWLRRLRTWLVLFSLNLFYRTYFVQGKLVSIPSIHFAQWSLVDRRSLLFVTNYDGAADLYLDDFFESLARGVAFIWHDTKKFPRTIDPRHLKLWVRGSQTLASVWYRAPVYEGLTVSAINNNTYIRKRLLRGVGQASARRWLRRFVTTPEEPTALARFSTWLKELSGVTP